MFSGSQFDTTSGGFTFAHSTEATPSPSKSRDSQGLVSVTVKQISEASHSGDEKSNFVINGADVTNVTLVGIVSEIDQRVTDIGFSIDDGTGKIGCRRWVNETFDKKEMEEIQEGMYVRINGHLRNFQGVKQLVAFSVRPVTNFDEVTFHFIDCIHSHLVNSKSQGGSLSQPSTGEAARSTPVLNKSSGNQTSTLSQVAKQFNVDGLKDYDQLVLECLRQSSTMELEKGMHMDEIGQQLKLPMEKIRESMRCLEDEGLIYSTIDEFHYKAT